MIAKLHWAAQAPRLDDLGAESLLAQIEHASPSQRVTDLDVERHGRMLGQAVARHDHKAFQDAKVLQFKVRVGQQKQQKKK